MTTRTYIYARVSTEDQLEKYGLPTQLRGCREYAAARGYQVIEEITDDGISGTVLDRPGLAKLRALAAQGAADCVLMLDVDRLSRELAHLLILKPEIEKRARLEFVTANFEDSPSGRMFFGIRGVIAQYERELTRERTMRGKLERARSGKAAGGRICYGYIYDEGTLTVDQQRAPYVRDIYAWFDAGASIREIARRLRASGAPTYGGGKWGHSSVRRILINETYAGVASYGTYKREGKRLVPRPPEHKITFPVPAIIGRAQWDRAQGRLAENPWIGRPASTALLARLLRCGSCGRKMGYERRDERYRCSGRDSARHHGEACHVSIHAPTWDVAAWRAIVQSFGNVAALRILIAEHESALRSEPDEDAEAIERRLRKARAKEDSCLRALLDPELAPGHATIKLEYRQAHAERQQCEAALARLRAPRSEAGSWVDQAAGSIAAYLREMRAPAERQGVLRGICDSAVWRDDAHDLRLHCFLPQELITTS